MSQQAIDGFDEPLTTDNGPAAPTTVNVEISYENLVTQLQQRMAQVFTALMTENAELRAQLQQLWTERNAALAKAEAAEALVADLASNERSTAF